MRQGQQNRRGRGRNRKSQNPLTRSFESNGPDVKIRGTPSHIAEKYISLARDAQSSGDPVLAESYLQHAEHYNRIIMAFREQQIQQGGGDPASMRRQPGLGEFGDADDLADDGDDEMGVADMGGVMGMNEPQPNVRGFETQQRHERQERHERQDRHDRHDGNRHRGDFQGRQGGRDRQFNGRNGGDRRQGGDQDSDQSRREARDNRDPNRSDQGRSDPNRSDPSRSDPSRSDQGRSDQGRSDQGRRGGGEARRREFAGPGADQPEFLRRSVRRPRRPREDAGESAPEAAPAEDNAE
ncbi:MAG: DUF4167 domain-containing protein [Hyphomicrobiaceae bacterium]